MTRHICTHCSRGSHLSCRLPSCECPCTMGDSSMECDGGGPIG